MIKRKMQLIMAGGVAFVFFFTIASVKIASADISTLMGTDTTEVSYLSGKCGWSYANYGKADTQMQCGGTCDAGKVCIVTKAKCTSGDASKTITGIECACQAAL